MPELLDDTLGQVPHATLLLTLLLGNLALLLVAVRLGQRLHRARRLLRRPFARRQEASAAPETASWAELAHLQHQR